MISAERPAQRLELLRQFAGLARAGGGIQHDQLVLGRLLRQRARSARGGEPSCSGCIRASARPGHAPRRRCGTAARAGCLAGHCRCPSAYRASWWCRKPPPCPWSCGCRSGASTSCQCTTRAMMSGARRDREDLVRQLGAAGGRLFERGDIDLHRACSSARRLAGASTQRRRIGASAGRARFTASRTST